MLEQFDAINDNPDIHTIIKPMGNQQPNSPKASDPQNVENMPLDPIFDLRIPEEELKVG